MIVLHTSSKVRKHLIDTNMCDAHANNYLKFKILLFCLKTHNAIEKTINNKKKTNLKTMKITIE